jgi:hypothetical protein
MNICNQHPYNLDAYCIDCNKLVCIECLISKQSVHKLHEILTVSSIVSREREKIQSIIKYHENVCSVKEKETTDLCINKHKNEILLDQCCNTTQEDQVLMTKYITCDTIKCRSHGVTSDVICTECKEFVCLKCLISVNNIHRNHTIKTRDEIIESIKQDLTNEIIATTKKIDECNTTLSLSRDNLTKRIAELNSSDQNIIDAYINKKNNKQKSCPKYRDNKVAIRNFLRAKQFDKLLNYTSYDLDCMINRIVCGKSWIEYILVNCTDATIIRHFIDNITDINYDINKRFYRKCMCESAQPQYSNIFELVFRYSTIEMLIYVFEKINSIPYGIWNLTKLCNGRRITFLETIPFDFMMRIIKEKFNKTDSNFITAIFCNSNYIDDEETFKKICYIIDNVIDFGDYRQIYHDLIPNYLLGYIIKYSKPNILEYVIKKGIDLEEEDCSRNSVSDVNIGYCTSIGLAIYYKKVSAVKLLIDANVNLEYENCNSNRPIHIAAYMGNLEIIKLLIDAQVKLDCKNVEGLMPIDILKLRKSSAEQQIIIDLFDAN